MTFNGLSASAFKEISGEMFEEGKPSTLLD
jgi:hypothetical protein